MKAAVYDQHHLSLDGVIPDSFSSSSPPRRIPAAPADPNSATRHLLSGPEGGGSVGGPASAGQRPKGAV